MTLLGPSGSGKTTILRLVAGFLEPTSGAIMLKGRDVSHFAPAQRDIGMVFQSYALFPHLSVAQNIAYGLKMRSWPRSRRHDRVEEMLALVGLEGMGDRLPRQLSGGQQQRVAVARALAFNPDLLLMDEPLGALDRELRVRMAKEIRRIHREFGVTVLYVTHDREEALSLSDRIAILHDGSLEAVDTPQNLFSFPSSRFVASFFGAHGLVPATLAPNTECRREDAVTVEALDQSVDVVAGCALRSGDSACIAVPRHDVRPGLPDESGALVLEGVVEDVSYLGNVVDVTLRLAGSEPDGISLGATLPSAQMSTVTTGTSLTCHVPSSSLVVAS
jgi:ABC-type Fe3+/spermidine/putrescine transport system ATPase subunit